MIGNIASYYTSGWVVTRYKPVSDGMGGFTQVSSSQGSVSGIMRPLTGERKLSADKHTAFADHRFYCTPTSIITPGRYLSTGGVKYEVVFPANMMNMDRLTQVDCKVVG